MLMGGTLSMSTIAGVLGGCSSETTTASYVPKTLTATQDELVATIAERIIPTTDTPGARDAGVNVFIDRMLTDWYTEEERMHFLAELEKADAMAREAYGTSFLERSTDEQNDLLAAMEEEALSWMDGNETSQNAPFFILIKQLTLFGYYTSEIGASQELKVMPLGAYRGDVPFEEIGRAWSNA
jgi:hypothetical protein